MPEAEVKLHYLHGQTHIIRVPITQYDTLTDWLQRFFDELSDDDPAYKNVERIEAELIEGDA